MLDQDYDEIGKTLAHELGHFAGIGVMGTKLPNQQHADDMYVDAMGEYMAINLFPNTDDYRQFFMNPYSGRLMNSRKYKVGYIYSSKWPLGGKVSPKDRNLFQGKWKFPSTKKSKGWENPVRSKNSIEILGG